VPIEAKYVPPYLIASIYAGKLIRHAPISGRASSANFSLTRGGCDFI